MQFYKFIFLFSCLVTMSSNLLAEKLSISTLSSYLNELVTLQAKFTQINSDGSLSTGSVFIKRPGRVRFEYDPPNYALVLASAGQLAIFDPSGNPAPERYPLSKTPLALILAEKVNLAQNRMVKSHKFDGTSTVLSIQDPQNPEYGRMALVFTGPKPQLRQWVIEDQSGEETVVVLNEMTTGVVLEERLFNIVFNQQQRMRMQ